MGGITPGFAGEVWLTDYGIRLPALKGTHLDAPEGFRAEGLVSNAVVPVNYIAGLQVPVLSIPLLVTSNWFYASLLNTMLGLPSRPEVVVLGFGGWWGYPRTGPIGDLVELGRVRVWNGGVAWQLSQVKATSLTLSLAFGQVVGAQLQVWGATIVGIDPYVPDLNPFNLAGAQSQNCSHNFPRNPSAWSLSLSNPLRPNATIPTIPPPGSQRFVSPLELNAGTFSSQFTLEVQAHYQWQGFADGPPGYSVYIVPPGGAGVQIRMTNPLFSKRYSYEFNGPRRKAPLVAMGRGNKDRTSPVIIT